MTVSALGMFAVAFAAFGLAMILGGIAQLFGHDAISAALIGGGIPPCIALGFHLWGELEVLQAETRMTHARAYATETKADVDKILAQRLADPAVQVEPEPDGAIDAGYVEKARKRSAVALWFREGVKAGGFSYGKMCDVATQDTHEALCKHYRQHGVLVDVKGNTGHVLSEDWPIARVLDKLDTIPLPPGRTPKITPTVNGGAARSSAGRKGKQIGETT